MVTIRRVVKVSVMKLAMNRIRSPYLPPRSQSLYRLSYPAHLMIIMKYTVTDNVKLCTLVEICRRFGSTRGFRIQSTRKEYFTVKIEIGFYFESSPNFYQTTRHKSY
jgi:hypothetical protein